MKSIEPGLLHSIIEGDCFTNEYYYIAHLLSKVLLGRNNDENYNILKDEVEKGQLLELHLFNEEKEIFISRVEGQYILYKPMLHNEATEHNFVITRNYEIMPGLHTHRYKGLEVKEYISFDKDSNLAFVDRTVLYSLSEEV